jgi:hypothetical protein
VISASVPAVRMIFVMIVSKLYLMTPEIQHGLRNGRVMRFLR